MNDEDMKAARATWWSLISRKGDPARRPNLSWEAFDAGWHSAMALVAASRKIEEDARREERSDEIEQRKWEAIHREWSQP